MRRTAGALVLLALVQLAACRGTAPASDEVMLARLVDSLAPAVEKAAGLKFRQPPRSAIRSRDQVRAYILAKLDQSFGPEKARGMQATYRLLGLLPDSLDLRTLILELYVEQVVGYYEPDSSELFVVAKADPTQLRVTIAHELVHALQHQYIALDSIMQQTGNSDRLLAAQAVIEGQATLIGLQVMVPDQNLFAMPEFWETYRGQLQQQQSTMPVFNKSPRILRESAIFPYLAGADFLRWWQGSELRDTLPFGRRMPVSSEQILHPYRYGQGDQPVVLRFTTSEPGISYEDVMGEFDLRVLGADLANSAINTEIATPLALGWGGDRFRVYSSPHGAAMVWYITWDDAQARFRFLATTGARLETRRRLGYRQEITSLELSGKPATRIVIAPDKWSGWSSIAAVEVVP